jgi:hypothetical protein
MSLPLDAIAELSRRIAAEYDAAFDVLGVVSTVGGSDHVEVLVTIAGCHDEPCRLLINLSRAEATTLERELRSKLGEALAAHAVNPT